MDTLTMAKSVYNAFGLNIESAIPFLDMPQDEGSPDVVIQYGKVPDGITEAKIKGVRYQAGPGEFLLQVDNVARYYVSNGNHILIKRATGAAGGYCLDFDTMGTRKIRPVSGLKSSASQPRPKKKAPLRYSNEGAKAGDLN